MAKKRSRSSQSSVRTPDAGGGKKSRRTSPSQGATEQRRTPSHGSSNRQSKSRPRQTPGQGRPKPGQGDRARPTDGAARLGNYRLQGWGLAAKMTFRTVALIFTIIAVFVFITSKLIGTSVEKEIIQRGEMITELYTTEDIMIRVAGQYKKYQREKVIREQAIRKELQVTGQYGVAQIQEMADKQARTETRVTCQIDRIAEIFDTFNSPAEGKKGQLRVGIGQYDGSIMLFEDITPKSLFGDALSKPPKIESDTINRAESELQFGDLREPCVLFAKSRTLTLPRAQGQDRDEQINVCLIVAVMSGEIDNARIKLTKQLAMFGILFIVLGTMGAVLTANTITHPIIRLVSDMDVVARGNFEHRASIKSRDEIGLLARTFNGMAEGLQLAREQARTLQSYEAELQTAREIQTNLLPDRIIELPGYDVFCIYMSAKDVGGDYYDFIPVDRENIAFVVADVSGKGVPGALVMSQVKTILNIQAVGNLSAASTLSLANEAIARNIRRGMFVTAIYAILNVRTRKLSVASAGHNPMILYRARSNKYELINPNGIALGFDKGPLFARTIKEDIIQLETGDRVVLYTDGVDESMSPEREEFGHETLYKFVADHPDCDSKTFVNDLMIALAAHQRDAEQHDDITVSTFKVL